jgi:hypothetical protein
MPRWSSWLAELLIKAKDDKLVHVLCMACLHLSCPCMCVGRVGAMVSAWAVAAVC